MSIDSWLIFVGVWTLAGLPLGPNALNCIALSSQAGFARSLWAVAGILAAALCHKAAVILGAAALLLANAELFQALRLAGAAYLVWMGLSMWRRGYEPVPRAGAQSVSAWRIVRRAFIISMSNPKAIFAYLAVFSQFLAPQQALAPQLAVLVPTALAVTGTIYLGYCALGTGIGRLLGSVRRRLLFNRSVGTFYICAGVGLAFVDGHVASARGR